MRIGGWWRLWLALAGVYGVVVTVVTIYSWPDVPNIDHHPSFLYRMSEPAQAVLNRAGLPTVKQLEQSLIDADRKGSVDEARKLAVEISNRRAKPWSGDPILLEMPNGHRLEVVGDTSNKDAELVGREYTRVLRAELDERRMSTALQSFLTWLIPVAAICALGLLVRWVYVGFRRGNQ